MIYEPEEDSHLLASCVKRFASGSVLDIGTGSGIQSITAAALKSVTRVLAVDISDESVQYVKKRVTGLKKIKVVKSDLFSNVAGRFDTIVFNPPYLPLDEREPEDSRSMTTGGKVGYELLARALYEVNDHLTRDGIALIVFSSLTNKNKIDEVLDEIGYDFDLIAEEKISFETLYVYKLKRNWLLHELFDKKIASIRKVAKGKRGLIFAGVLQGKKIAVKAQRLDLQIRTIEREAEMIKRVNKKGIAPRLLSRGKNYFTYEFAEGEFIKDFLEHSKRQETKKVFLEVLRQCRVLDKMHITKKEMGNPYKHVIVGKKITLIDFERAHYDDFPQNVTQFCQYILKNHALFSQKGMRFDKKKLIELAKHYKNNQTELNYKRIKLFVSAL